MESIKADNKKIAKNTAFLYIRMGFVLIVSLYTSRVVLRTLGVEDFGVYSVVGGFVSLFGFLNATLSASMQRFYNYEMGQNGESGVKRVYNTGFWIHVALAVILFVLLESFGLWYVNNILVVPESRIEAVNYLYQATVVSMVFVVIQIPYAGIVMAYEKMNYYAAVAIADVFLKLAIVIVLPFMPFDKLITYSYLMLSIQFFNLLLYFVYSKRRFNAVRLERLFDKKLFQEILSFSGWNLVGTFAFMMKGQGLNMLLNFFFGPIVNAARGVAFQVHSAVSGFTSNIATSFRPQIVDSYAKGNYDRTCNLFFAESKICYVLISIIVVPVVMEMEYLLHLWLGESVPPQTTVFASLVLADLLVGNLNPPCTQVTFASGNIRRYQIFSSIVHLCLLPTCWMFLKLGIDAVSVFVITIIFTIVNQVVCLMNTRIQLPFSLRKYLYDVIAPCLLFSTALPIIPLFIRLNFEPSLMRLSMIFLADIIFSVVLLWAFVLKTAEKSMISSYINKKIRKRDA